MLQPTSGVTLLPTYVLLKATTPIYFGSQSTCGCNCPMEKFGDHFFTCQYFHPKNVSHNMIRDAFHLIVSEIGALACRSHSFSLSSLPRASHSGPVLPYIPSRQPLYQMQALICFASLLPFAKVAVNVHITNSLPLPSDGDQNYTVDLLPCL